MDSIDYVTFFWQEDRQAHFNCYETRLYFYLLKVAEEKGLNKHFEHADGVTTVNMCTSLNTMKAARISLVERKMISYETGGQCRSHKTRYQLVTPKLTGKMTPKAIPNLPPKPPKKETSQALHWKPFVDEFNKWYLQKIGGSYNYMPKDFAHLKKIYQFLEKRAEEKQFAFTEENLIKAFKFFLQKAWDKDDWLKRNFTIPNLLSQFNQIVNGTPKTSKQPTGAEVSTGSLFSRIDSMPD